MAGNPLKAPEIQNMIDDLYSTLRFRQEYGRPELIARGEEEEIDGKTYRAWRVRCFIGPQFNGTPPQKEFIEVYQDGEGQVYFGKTGVTESQPVSVEKLKKCLGISIGRIPIMRKQWIKDMVEGGTAELGELLKELRFFYSKEERDEYTKMISRLESKEKELYGPPAQETVELPNVELTEEVRLEEGEAFARILNGAGNGDVLFTDPELEKMAAVAASGAKAVEEMENQAAKEKEKCILAFFISYTTEQKELMDAEGAAHLDYRRKVAHVVGDEAVALHEEYLGVKKQTVADLEMLDERHATAWEFNIWPGLSPELQEKYPRNFKEALGRAVKVKAVIAGRAVEPSPSG